MREGSGFDWKEYYLKTDRGLWIRSRYLPLEGSIVLEYQSRIISTGDGRLVVLNDEGEVAGNVFSQSRPLHGCLPAEWNEVGSITVDTAPFLAFLRKVQTRGGAAKTAYQGVCRSAVRLAAHGYDLGQIMPWFSAPLDGEWLVEGEYRIESGAVGSLDGLDGVTILVGEGSRTREGAIECTLLYDGREVEETFEISDLALSAVLL